MSGRWITPDPAGMAAADPADPQTWNRYAYVANRPNDHVDRLGLDPDILGIILGGVGGGVGGVGGGIVTDIIGGVVGAVLKNNVGQIWSESQGLPGGMTLPRPSVASVLGIPSVAGPGCDFAPCVPNELKDLFSTGSDDASAGAMFSWRIAVWAPYARIYVEYSITKKLATKAKKLALWYICNNSPNGAIENWIETGATKGAVVGAYGGVAAFGIPTEGIGAPLGAAFGGIVGGVFGATGGVIWGSVAAVVCSSVGVYSH